MLNHAGRIFRSRSLQCDRNPVEVITLGVSWLSLSFCVPGSLPWLCFAVEVFTTTSFCIMTIFRFAAWTAFHGSLDLLAWMSAQIRSSSVNVFVVGGRDNTTPIAGDEFGGDLFWLRTGTV